MSHACKLHLHHRLSLETRLHRRTSLLPRTLPFPQQRFKQLIQFLQYTTPPAPARSHEAPVTCLLPPRSTTLNSLRYQLLLPPIFPPLPFPLDQPPLQLQPASLRLHIKPHRYQLPLLSTYRHRHQWPMELPQQSPQVIRIQYSRRYLLYCPHLCLPLDGPCSNHLTTNWQHSLQSTQWPPTPYHPYLLKFAKRLYKVSSLISLCYYIGPHSRMPLPTPCHQPNSPSKRFHPLSCGCSPGTWVQPRSLHQSHF